MPSTTVNGRQVARSTSGKINSVTVVTPPPGGRYSVHDCRDPGAVSAMNCLWPQCNGAADWRTVRFGIVVYTSEPGGVFIVNHTP
jgi:hypothetical protein